ncbi:MAG: methyltransferase domain-containing protein [Alphaproteobacteria bacterium]|nr:methyltransferase domain-containing protein [Alphaproteobacteria bacterium]
MSKVSDKANKMEQRVLACLLRGDVDGAERWVEQMLEADEDNPVALALMADICQLRGEFQDALGLLALAIDQAPQEHVYLDSFVRLAKQMSFAFTQHNDLMFRTVSACLVRDDLNCAPLWQIWLGLLATHPELSCLLRAEISFSDKKTAAAVLHPFFVRGLNHLIVLDSGFESFLAKLRNTLRQELAAEQPLWPREDFLRLASALAHYACMVEYIFDVTEEEAKWTADVRKALAENPAVARAEVIAVLACYEMLGTLPFAAALLPVCDAFDVLKPIADLQIREPERRLKIMQDIPAVTPIDEGISAQVQGQYEVFPYPRWTYLPLAVSPGEHERKLRPDAKILVAGCGTGYESAFVALMLPKADVLAFDLSRLSLAYAIARAQDLNMKQITFAHGDILRMGERADRYDYIRSSGVLHHMEDPRAGWQVLCSILKPRGLMRIALYSEYARQDVVAARKVIAEKGFKATAESMREFRRQVDTLLPPDICASLRKRGDFYQMSMLCDLLFHVQEHRFTLPQLAEMLSSLGLEFLGFSLPAGAAEAFREMHGPSADDKDLQKWDALEQARPETFRAMYQFWCRAKK